MNVLDIMSSSLPPSQPPSTSTSPSTSSTSKSISLCPPVVKADVGTHVRVGVGVVVKDPNNPHHIFCGIRKGSHGAGTLALPGGHLEMYESWEECAQREVKEECGLLLDIPILYGHTTNDPMPAEHKHYVTIFMLATCCGTTAAAEGRPQPHQIPQTLEPEKCEGWSSYSWKELQQRQQAGELFGPLDRLVQDTPTSILEFLS